MRKTLAEITTELREEIERQTALTERYNVTRVLLLNDGLTDKERRMMRADFDVIKEQIRDVGIKISGLRRIKHELMDEADRKQFAEYRK